MRYLQLNRQFNWVSRHDPGEFTSKQLDRLRTPSLWERTGDGKLACQTFGLSQATLYQWRKHFNPHDPSFLREYSRGPHRLRRPQWSPSLDPQPKSSKRALSVPYQTSFSSTSLPVMSSRTGNVIEVHHRATSSLAAQFLDTLQTRMPFPIRS